MSEGEVHNQIGKLDSSLEPKREFESELLPTVVFDTEEECKDFLFFLRYSRFSLDPLSWDDELFEMTLEKDSLSEQERKVLEKLRTFVQRVRNTHFGKKIELTYRSLKFDEPEEFEAALKNLQRTGGKNPEDKYLWVNNTGGKVQEYLGDSPTQPGMILLYNELCLDRVPGGGATFHARTAKEGTSFQDALLGQIVLAPQGLPESPEVRKSLSLTTERDLRTPEVKLPPFEKPHILIENVSEFKIFTKWWKLYGMFIFSKIMMDAEKRRGARMNSKEENFLKRCQEKFDEIGSDDVFLRMVRFSDRQELESFLQGITDHGGVRGEIGYFDTDSQKVSEYGVEDEEDGQISSPKFGALFFYDRAKLTPAEPGNPHAFAPKEGTMYDTLLGGVIVDVHKYI